MHTYERTHTHTHTISTRTPTPTCTFKHTQEAQDRFDKVKAVFDAISSQSVGVTTAREGGRGGETAGDSSDDDAEMDAALSRFVCVSLFIAVSVSFSVSVFTSALVSVSASVSACYWTSHCKRLLALLSSVLYSMAKTYRMPYLCRSFSTREPYN